MKNGQLRAGLDERQIRCEIGLIPGDGSPLATGQRTPLFIKSVVLYNGLAGQAIVTLDIMGIPYDYTLQIRHAVTSQVPWLEENIMLCCSHTHVAPSSLPSLHTYMESFNPHAGPEAYMKERAFLDNLQEDIIASVIAASGSLFTASIGFASLELPWLTFNRRRLTRNYGVISHWMGIPANQAYGVEGPIDPELVYFLIRGNDFEPRAVLWNFAGHNSFHFDDQYSADIAFSVQQAFDEKIGCHLPCLFATGCSGDINYYDYSMNNETGANYGMEKATEAIASAIVATYREVCTLTEVELDTANACLVMATRDITREWWKDDIQKKLPGWLVVGYQEKELASRQNEGKSTYTTEVMAMRIGSWAMVGMPGEVFAQFGLDIKSFSPFRITLVSAYANDYAGYIPTREAFIHGSYEAWPVLNARIGPEGGYMMLDKLQEMLKALAK